MIDFATEPRLTGAVRRAARGLVWLVLALWLPATDHCRLEALPGFHFLASCCSEDTGSEPAHSCESDFCGEIETGCYKAADTSSPVLPVPAVVALFTTTTVPALAPEGSRCAHAIAGEPPLDLPEGWRFLQRAAPAIRAPAFAG